MVEKHEVIPGANGRTRSVVLAGVGGQGTVLATNILGQALLLAGYDVKTSEVHGMAQRGGSVSSAVRFGQRVLSPLVPVGSADFIVGSEMLEALRCAGLLGPEGVFIVSLTRLDPLPVLQGKAPYPEWAPEALRSIAPRSVFVDAPAIAERAGNRRAANTVLLGILSQYLDVSIETWMDVLEAHVPGKVREVNRKAFMLGREHVG